MKCLEKDRARRYDTANGLATDIDRHLRNEPVLAGPPSVVYRLRKFVTRNRVPVAAGFVVALALVLGTVGTSVGLMRALEAETAAEQRADTLAELVTFQKSQLADLDVVVLLAGGPTSRWRALPHLREAVEERERVLGPEDPNTLFGMLVLGKRLCGHDNSEAEYYLRRALDGARGVLADDDPVMIKILSWNGQVLRNLGRLNEAEELGAKAVRLARIRFSNPDAMGAMGGLGMPFVQYGNTLRDMERFEQAEVILIEAHTIRESTLRGTTQFRAGTSHARHLAAMYDAWHASQPGAGYDAKAAEWRRVRRRRDAGAGERDGGSP